MVTMVRTATGQIVPGSGRSVTSYRDELRWRKRLKSAVDAGDPRAELNARKMLNSIFLATTPVRTEPTPFERVGAGAASLAGGINQLVPPSLGGFTPEEEQSFAEGRQLYRQGLPPGIDWWGAGGEAAAAAPFMLAPQLRLGGGLLGRSAAGAGGGGTGGGLLFAETPQERLTNVGVGATGGAAGAAVLSPAASLLSRIGSRQPLPPEALERQARAEQFGYTGDAAPTRGQVTQDPQQLAEEFNLRNIRDVGAPLQERALSQEAQDLANIERFQASVGGPTEPAAAGTAALKAAQRRAKDWQTDVAARYLAARSLRPDATVPGVRLTDAFSDVLKERRNAIPSDVRRRINELTKAESGVEPVELENLDKLMSDYVGADRATNSAIGMLKERLRGVMNDFASGYGGAYLGAVGEASRRFAAMGEMKDLTNRLVRGAIDPLKVVPSIKGAGLKELTALRDFVADAAPEQWQQVRAGVLSDVIDRAMPSGQFRQGAYNRAIRKIGRERLAVLFGDDAAKELVDFGRVVQDLYGPRRGASPNRSGSGIGIYNLMRDRFNSILRFGRFVPEALEEGGKRRQVREALDPTLAVSGRRRPMSVGGLLEDATVGAGTAAGIPLIEAREAHRR